MSFLISIRAIAISFVAILLSAILISPTPVSATEVAQADAKNASTKYVSDDFGFTFSLPKGWTLKEIKKTGGYNSNFLSRTRPAMKRAGC